MMMLMMMMIYVYKIMMFMTAMMMMILAMKKKKMVMIMMISCLAIRTGISCRLADLPVLVIRDWSTVLMFFFMFSLLNCFEL